MSTEQEKRKAEKEALEEAKELAKDLANVVLQQQSPPGTTIPEAQDTDDEYVDSEPDTESVGRTPVTGQPAGE